MIVLVLPILGFLIYSNTFQSSFVFDDAYAIVGNPAIHHPADLALIWETFNTRFITGLSLAFNYALGKENTLGYHLFNISVHVLNSFWVYLLVNLTFETPRMRATQWVAPTTAFFTALLFLTHPVQTQAVTYIWQRATSLAAFFYLGALVFYIRARLVYGRPSGSPLHGPLYFGLCLVFTVLGMFTKEIVFTLPFMILLYEIVFLKNLPFKKYQRALLWAPLALTLLIIPWGLTQTGEKTLEVIRPKNTHLRHQENLIHAILEMTRTESKMDIPRKDYLLTQLNVLRTYLRLFIFPFHQSVDYNYRRAKSLAEPPTFLSLLLLLGLFGSGVMLLKKNPLMAFGIFWFFLTASVESLVVSNNFMFEHRMYLPMTGLCLFLAIAICYLFKNNQKVVAIVLWTIVGCYSLLTYQRNFVWKNEFTLWDDAVKKFPYNGRAYNARGFVLAKKGLAEDALADYNKAIEFQPDAEAYSNRASLYEEKGLLDLALADRNKAVETAPAEANYYNKRGAHYKNKGLLDLAIRDFSKAIELEPGNVDAYNNRAFAYESKNLLDQALADCNKAIQTNPHFASAYNNRAVVYGKKGLPDLALLDLDKALELDPNFTVAAANREALKKAMGDRQ